MNLQLTSNLPTLLRRGMVGFGLLVAAAAGTAATIRLEAVIGPALQEGRDVSAALQAVLDRASDGDLVDGSGRTFRVDRGLVVRKSIVLRNLRLQRLAPANGEDTAPQLRMLEVRGSPKAPLQVQLQKLSIDRGRSPLQGSPTKAAGVWLANVRHSAIDGLEITGNGRGTGLVILDADDLLINRLHVHDMAWSPCAADARRLLLEEIHQAWNGTMLLSMDDCSAKSAERQRVREPLAGVIIARSQGVTFNEPVIERLMARLADGAELPWQTDGMTIKSGQVDADGQAVDSRIVVNAARIRSVWEGIDINGLPIRGVTVRNALVQDTHAFGIKAANGAQDVVVEHSRVERAGLAGFVVSGDGDAGRQGPATRHVRISDSVAVDTGFGGRWRGQATIAGFRLMSTRRDASDVVLERFSAVDAQASPTMAFGVHAECSGSLSIDGADIRGAMRSPVSIAETPCH